MLYPVSKCKQLQASPINVKTIIKISITLITNQVCIINLVFYYKIRYKIFFKNKTRLSIELFFVTGKWFRTCPRGTAQLIN